MKKYFRHFVDAGEGRSLNALVDEMGHSGLCYWLLVELCAKKWFNEASHDAKVAAGEFNFHQRIVRQQLRMSPTTVRRLLDVCQTNGLLKWNSSGSTVQILMPKLLELLDPKLKSSAKRFRESSENVLYTDTDTETDTETKREREPDDDVLAFLDPPPTPIRPPTNSPIKSVDDLLKSIPIVQRDLWTQKFGDSRFQEEVGKAYQWHILEPAKEPRNAGHWHKKLVSWFSNIKDSTSPDEARNKREIAEILRGGKQ